VVKPAAKRAAKAKTSKAKTSRTKSSKKTSKSTAKPEPMHVVVVGAGRMGADIALNFVIAGWRCDVIEPDAKVRERAAAYWQQELKRLGKTARGRYLHLHADGAAPQWPAVDLAVEAVFEDLKLKHAILKEIEAKVRRDTLITTNTSSLKISDVTSVLKHADRSAGLHFMIPAHVMLAVEITRGRKTAAATMTRLVSWMTAMGKVPIVLNRDVPGMLINRIQHAMYREIYHLIDEGIATAEAVDLAVRFGFGFRYPILGPVVSRDIHGLPVHLAVSKQIYPTLHNGTTPSRKLSQLVKQGHHGVRTGRGFYQWDPKTTEQRLLHFTKLLEQGLRRVKQRGKPTEF
jgi:3-hydroxybutyryl-CoA dehydrogenase